MFAGCRAGLGWSVQRAVIAAKGKGHAALTLNKLRWLEAGKTKAPDREVLSAVCDVYGLDYSEVASAFVAALYGRDLVRQPSEAGSAAGGAADVPASARRISELVSELEAYKKKLVAAGKIARNLVNITITASRKKGRTASQRVPGSG